MTSPLPLNTILKYLNAAPGRRGTVVRNLLAQSGSPYAPQFDFWLKMRNAIVSDRRTTRDGAAVRAAAANVRDDKKKARYREAAAAWDGIHPRWGGSSAALVSPSTVTIGGLPVHVRPAFGEQRATGPVEVALVWLIEERLTPDVIGGALRIVELAYPGETAVLVDVRRRHVHTSEQADLRHYDSWLASEAAGLAHLLDEAA